MLCALVLVAFLAVASAFLPATLPAHPNHATGPRRIGTNQAMLSSADPNHAPMSSDEDCDRRSFLSSSLRTAAFVTGTSIISSSESVVASDSVKLVPYEDKDCGIQISVPEGWERSEQTLPDRRKIVFFIDPNSGGEDKTLLFVAYTSVRDDYTQLSSFGSVEQVGQTTILPKGKIAVEEAESEMISAENKKNAYIFDYTSKVGGQPKRHFRTIFSLNQGATGGAGSVLVTITAQTPEVRYGEMKSLFDEMVDSYGKLGASKK